MPAFIHTLHLKSDSDESSQKNPGQKTHLEDAVAELKEKGAHILGVKSLVAKALTCPKNWSGHNVRLRMKRVPFFHPEVKRNDYPISKGVVLLFP